LKDKIVALYTSSLGKVLLSPTPTSGNTVTAKTVQAMGP